MLSPVSIGMGDRLRAGIPPWYVTKPTRSTQPYIPLGLLNRVPALTGWGKGGNVTSAGWQLTLCDPIWHMSFHSGAVLVAQTAVHFFFASCYVFYGLYEICFCLTLLVCTPIESFFYVCVTFQSCCKLTFSTVVSFQVIFKAVDQLAVSFYQMSKACCLYML